MVYSIFIYTKYKINEASFYLYLIIICACYLHINLCSQKIVTFLSPPTPQLPCVSMHKIPEFNCFQLNLKFEIRVARTVFHFCFMKYLHKHTHEKAVYVCALF